MDLNLKGQSVVRVCFDAAFTVLTSGDYELRVETDAIIKTTPEGGLVPFDPEFPGAAAVHLVRLMREPISLVEVGDRGELAVIFESGMELTVVPHAEYEAWGIVGPHGSRVVCLPGGEVARWGEK